MEDEIEQMFPEDEAGEGSRFDRDMDDLLFVMRTETGRRFVHRLLKDTSVESLNFSGEIAQDSFMQGERAVGVRLTNRIKEADFDLYVRMLLENRHG